MKRMTESDGGYEWKSMGDVIAPLLMTQMEDDSVEFKIRDTTWSIKNDKGDNMCKSGWYWTPKKPVCGKPKKLRHGPTIPQTKQTAIREVDCQFRYDI